MLTTTEQARKPTTQGRCIICGSGSCAVWRFATLTEDKHVDQAALLAAHKVVPAEVEHDKDGEPCGGAPVLAPMVDAPSALYKRHGGRVAPLPPRKAVR